VTENTTLSSATICNVAELKTGETLQLKICLLWYFRRLSKFSFFMSPIEEVTTSVVKGYSRLASYQKLDYVIFKFHLALICSVRRWIIVYRTFLCLGILDSIKVSLDRYTYSHIIPLIFSFSNPTPFKTNNINDKGEVNEENKIRNCNMVKVSPTKLSNPRG
jgi:hypothetical protein